MILRSFIRQRTAIVCCAALAAAVSIASAASAQSYNWQGPTSNSLWSNSLNWDNTLPGATNTAIFSAAGAGQTVDLGPANVNVASVTFNGNVTPGNTIAAATNPA